MSKKTTPGNATVTIAHSRTSNLKEICANADIIIAALGIPNFVKSDMVKNNAVIIDVGINKIDDHDSSKKYRLVGDVDFENVKHKVSAITPVPGGVGPMTITALLDNTWKAYSKTIK
jgi:methylenetetrahydrofolate dehydrogenase (NADP+)/methenyltetrahydrofolate cyclohydrolase